HGVGRFGVDRLDHFQHFGRGFADVGIAFAGKHIAVARASGRFGSLGNVDCHFTEQAELHQAGARVSINTRVAVDLDVDPRFVFWFARGRARGWTWFLR